MIRILPAVLIFLIFFIPKPSFYKIIFNFGGLSSFDIYNSFISEFEYNLLQSKKIKDVYTLSYDSKAVVFVKCYDCLDVIKFYMPNAPYFMDDNYFTKYKYNFFVISKVNDYAHLFKNLKSFQNEGFFRKKKSKIYGELQEAVQIKIDENFFYNIKKPLFEFNLDLPKFSGLYMNNSNNAPFFILPEYDDIKKIGLKVKNSIFPLFEFFSLNDVTVENFEGHIERDGFLTLLFKTDFVKNNLIPSLNFEKVKNGEILYFVNHDGDFGIFLKKIQTFFQSNRFEPFLFVGFCPIKPDLNEKRNVICAYFNGGADKNKLVKLLDKTNFDYYFSSDNFIRLKIFISDYQLMNETDFRILNKISSVLSKRISFNNLHKFSNVLKFDYQSLLKCGITTDEIIDYVMTFYSGKVIANYYENDIKKNIFLKSTETPVFSPDFNIYSKKLNKYVPIGQFVSVEKIPSPLFVQTQDRKFVLEHVFVFNSKIEEFFGMLTIFAVLLNDGAEFSIEFR